MTGLDIATVPSIIENKKSSEFTFQRYKEYKDRQQNNENTKSTRPATRPAARPHHQNWYSGSASNNYNRTHWSKERESFPKKSFGRNHWNREDHKKRKLPTPKNK